MVFILNSSFEVLGTLSRLGTTNQVTPYFDDNHVEDLSTGAETFTFSTFAGTREGLNIQLGNFIAFKVKNGYKLFQISEVIEEHGKEHTKTAYCETAGVELINEIVRATSFPSANLKQILTYALQDTEFQVGKIDGAFADVHTIELKDPMKVYDFIQEYVVGLFGAEISYRVEIQGGRVVGKYIDCYAERGDFNGLRFEYSKNISKVKKTADLTELATALVPQGKNGTTIKDAVASDKPKGQDWIGDEDAFNQYNRNGSHIFDVFKYDTESPAELLAMARKELAERCKPKIKYTVDVELLNQDVEIGETVYVIDNEFNPPLHLSARVSQLQTCRTDKTKSKVILSNFKEVVSRVTDEVRDVASLIDERFPIGSSDIKDNAITSNKVQQGAIGSTHIQQNTITTDHLTSNSITSDKIEAGQIKAEHILAGAIKTNHLEANSITAGKISAEAIETKHLKADSIETKHLKSNSISTDKLQANSITANHIKADSIETEHIKSGQVVGDHILGDQIDANHIKANAITSDKISAGAISTDKLEAGSITSDKVSAGAIESDHISAGSITSGKISADSISSNHLQANSVTAGKIQADSISSNHLQTNSVTAGKISAGAITTDKLSANSITSDKIGANQIQASHIKAGSITSDKVTTGELITNSAQIKTGIIGSAHIGNGQITNAHIGKGAIGEANILDGSITSAKITSASISNAHIKDASIESAKIKEINAGKITSGTINTGLINIDGTNGKLRIRDNRLQVFDKSATPVERVSVGDVNGDGTVYGLRVRGQDGQTVLYDENGVYNEGITNGAITNPKISENAVDSRTLNLKELFVEDSGFINELHSTKIYASQLQVDEIRNDLININGLVTFESLDPSLNDLLFIKDSDKTYINGNTILTNTIKASQIDLYNGLTVQKDGLETFSVATDGAVKVSGTIESFGFSNEAGHEKGYQLTPDGDAYLNDAIVRGSVILPNAGVTNYGSSTGNNVRFWAGASYEERNNAPFKVYENGRIVATEGEFGGTFTGELNIGNIRIKDTNSTSAEFSIKTNDNTNEVIRLTDASARFGVDLSVDNIFRANVQTKEMEFGDGVYLDLIKGQNTLYLGKNDSTTYDVYNFTSAGGGKHKLMSKNGYGGLSFIASGTQVTAGTETPFDYKFARMSADENVNVVVKGNLVIDNKITMADDNKIELVSVSGANSGIDFMIR